MYCARRGSYSRASFRGRRRRSGIDVLIEIRKVAQNMSRISCCDTPWWNVFRDDASSADHSSTAYTNARKDDRLRADPNMVFYDHCG